MFRLPFLYKTSNELLFKPLSTYRVKVQTDCVRHFRTSANNKRSTACESRPTSNDRKLEQSLTSLKQSIREQGDLVRKLKESGTSETELKTAIHELLRRKQELLDREHEPTSQFQTNAFDRAKFDILVRRRFIFDQSYEIYGGASGLYDFGPIGCAIKANLLQLWRQFFIVHDHMLEVDCPILTIEPVFKASGHIERFSDYLVKDVVTNECFRVDHLIKTHLNELAQKQPQLKDDCIETITKINGATKEDLQAIIVKYNVRSPSTGNALSDPLEFNLMFDTPVGPLNITKGFLRPETAQGIFVNFKRLLEYNQGQLPFAAAQIGSAFRNEIAPKSGLLRVREFTLAEIEHFFDPSDSSHPKFQDVANTKMFFYTANDQLNNLNAKEYSIGDAVERGLVANETLGYFLARIQQFLICVGISTNSLRFRQHLSTEMAHYAVDCWDAECLTSHGWIECVGCADRSAFDLKQHSKASGCKLTAERRLVTPKEIMENQIVAKKEFLRKLSNKKSKQIVKFLANLNQHQQTMILQKVNETGFYDVTLEDDQMVRFDKSSIEVNSASKLRHVEEITPNVVEPSFGIGRILYALLEHTFRKRDGDSNSYFALPPNIAAHKCSILPLSNKPEFQPFIRKISADLFEENLSHKIDDMSGSIGRRYVRGDEIGIPFVVTVDFDTLKISNTVTLRERDTKEQIRIPLNEVTRTIKDLCANKTTWHQLSQQYPKFDKQTSVE